VDKAAAARRRGLFATTADIDRQSIERGEFIYWCQTMLGLLVVDDRRLVVERLRGANDYLYRGLLLAGSLGIQ